MRLHRKLASAALVLIVSTACSSTEGSPADTTAPVSSGSAQPPSAPTSGPAPQMGDACALLTAPEVQRLLGETATGQAQELMGVPTCKWTSDSGRFVQTMAAPSDRWARALPQAVDTLKASGITNDPENVRKLEEAADLIRSGKTVAKDKACELFSALLEVQGQEKGLTSVVNVVPNQAHPLAITGQTCAEGVFTSVTLADSSGLDAPLPTDAVETLASTVHSRAVEAPRAA